MSLSIIDSRNSGYPCVPEIDDPTGTAFKVPYFEYGMTVSDNTYPLISKLPPFRSTRYIPPEPQYTMRCMGDSINSGYPCILQLLNVTAIATSSLYFKHRKVNSMYYKGNFIKNAYCNGQEVFRIDYVIN